MENLFFGVNMKADIKIYDLKGSERKRFKLKKKDKNN